MGRGTKSGESASKGVGTLEEESSVVRLGSVRAGSQPNEIKLATDD